jgi:TonB-dependent receptor
MEQVGNSNIGDVSGQNNNAIPVAYGPDFTQGASNAGTQQYAGASRWVPITSYMLNTTYRHDGAGWQLESGGFFSKSTGRFRDIDYGFFQNSTLRMERATLRYGAIERDHPGEILVRNSAGQMVAPFTLGEYRILTVTSAPKNELDYIYGGKAYARRTFDLAVPINFKTGFDWREQIRDLRSAAPRWNFVGPDRVAGTADDLAGRYDLLETEFSEGVGVRGSETAQWPDRYKLYNLFVQHPEYFQFNEVGTLQASTANSRKIVETISAAYVRFDSRLFANRLLLVGGVRFEHTNDYGEGQLNDIRATYRQDANGRLILDAAGRPIRVSTDAAVRARLQFKERGAKAERSYDDFFPSFNATFSLRENLIIRAAYARTFGRPNFQSIVPAIAVADPAAADRVITVTDPGLLPWTGDGYDLSLEYYFNRGGLVSAGVFRKDIRNFFGSSRTPATSERLAEIGLTDEFLNYDIVGTVNVGDARVDGLELNYRQEMVFLPHWARGLQIHANATLLDLNGSSRADFDSFVRRSYNWGISLNRPRFTLSLNWHKRGRQQGGLFTNNNAPADTFQYTAPSQRLDLNASLRVTKRISIYGVVRNVTGSDATQRAGEIFSSQTPDYARLRIRREAPIALNFGVKGEF